MVGLSDGSGELNSHLSLSRHLSKSKTTRYYAMGKGELVYVHSSLGCCQVCAGTAGGEGGAGKVLHGNRLQRDQKVWRRERASLHPGAPSAS